MSFLLKQFCLYIFYVDVTRLVQMELSDSIAQMSVLAKMAHIVILWMEAVFAQQVTSGKRKTFKILY